MRILLIIYCNNGYTSLCMCEYKNKIAANINKHQNINKTILFNYQILNTSQTVFDVLSSHMPKIKIIVTGKYNF